MLIADGPGLDGDQGTQTLIDLPDEDFGLGMKVSCSKLWSNGSLETVLDFFAVFAFLGFGFGVLLACDS